MADNQQKLDFKEFLLSEYENTAQAHFKSIEMISNFFRYYLLIMSLPISIIAIVLQLSKSDSGSVSLSAYLNQYGVAAAILFFVIALAGGGVFLYVVNLRLDAILYARVVNGIRKKFYDSSGVDINFQSRMRMLPQSSYLPNYFEHYFWPVVIVFGLINAVYFSIGNIIVVKYWWEHELGVCIICGIILLGVFVITLHFVSYWWCAQHREHEYLKSNIIGVDIDGVLNKHREHFVQLLREHTGIDIRANEIIVMPVHEHLTLGVSREQECMVFNDPAYWINMPSIEGAASVLIRLRNNYHVKVYICTFRAWPDDKREDVLKGYIKQFLRSYDDISPGYYFLKLLLHIDKNDPTSLASYLIKKLKELPIHCITKRWLYWKDIKYDKFLLEKGNDNSSDPRGRFKNRFYWAQKEKIRFFVEDDLEKAIKLAFICDVVFLIRQPYNQPSNDLPPELNNPRLRENLPSNVIPVDGWDEIYRHIRRLV